MTRTPVLLLLRISHGIIIAVYIYIRMAAACASHAIYLEPLEENKQGALQEYVLYSVTSPNCEIDTANYNNNDDNNVVKEQQKEQATCAYHLLDSALRTGNTQTFASFKLWLENQIRFMKDLWCDSWVVDVYRHEHHLFGKYYVTRWIDTSNNNYTKFLVTTGNSSSDDLIEVINGGKYPQKDYIDYNDHVALSSMVGNCVNSKHGFDSIANPLQFEVRKLCVPPRLTNNSSVKQTVEATFQLIRCAVHYSNHFADMNDILNEHLINTSNGEYTTFIQSASQRVKMILMRLELCSDTSWMAGPTHGSP